jgi:hypothetical protein
MARTVLIKARELSDVDVDLISAVHRPASRVPFGIMKSEDSVQKKSGGTMFDLLFKREAGAPVASVITSVILKSEPSEAVSKALGDLGLKIDEKQSVDGITMLVQDSVIAKEDTMLVKLDDNVAVMVPMIKMDGDFAAHCASRGFYPSISIATDLLQEELYKSMSKAKDGADAAEMMGKATADFGSYMTQLARGLPSTVFKMEESADLKAAFVVKAGAAPAAETEKTPAEKIDEIAVDAAEKTEAKDAADDKAAEKVTEVEKSEPQGVDVAAMAELITKSVMDGIKPQLDGFGGKIDDFAGRLATVEEVSKSADRAVRGTVLGTVFDDRQPGHIEKSEDDGPPCIDTAYSHRTPK